MVLKKLFQSFVVACLMLLAIASPALAISNPDAIAFYAVGSIPKYKVFYNVLETGDWLIAAEQYVHYTVTPNETASEAFLFEVLDTTGTNTLASTTLKQYEAKPIAIYMSAAQVVTASVNVGDALIIRITGNPLLFPSTTNNTVTATLAASDYVDQLLGVDNGIPTSNNLRNFLIDVADDIETFDAPPAGSEYIETVKGIRYLTALGGDIFLEGIPGLDAMCPILLQYSLEPLMGDEPTATGAYVSGLSPLAKWGATSANGLTSIGLYLGFGQQQAGMLVFFILAVAGIMYAYIKLQNVASVALLAVAMMFFGAWLGLVPLALVFVIAIGIVIASAFFFFGQRGVF